MEPSEHSRQVVHLWCGPRSLSTATLYSFNQHYQTTCLDEPLYAAYLATHPHITRPYKDKLIEISNCDGHALLRDVASMRYADKSDAVFSRYGVDPKKSVVFCKHISKHLEGIDTSLIIGDYIHNIFLIRDPLSMISSWTVKGEVHGVPSSLHSLGLPHLLQIFSETRQATGKIPIVIDSDILRQHPREVLTEVCRRVGIPFDESMLQWPAGPKAVDGLWASFWYDSVHKSTGFGSYVHHEDTSKKPNIGQPLSAEDVALYREALPIYEILKRYAIGVDHLSPGTSRTLQEGGLYISDPNEPDKRLADPRNANILVWMSDRIVPRDQGKVSAFDSAVQGGDAVWEGLRVYKGGVFKLDEHLDRLIKSAKAMAFDHVPTKEYIITAIKRVLVANGMYDGAHMRMTLTRGAKLSSSMNPKFNVFGSNLIILPEWKPVGDPATYNNSSGVTLITASNRRNPPQCVDSKIHHCNLINNILPKIQANVGGAADAIMLDVEGYVSETNATNLFCVKNNAVYTPFADHCLPGVTRSVVMEIVRDVIRADMQERRLSLFEFHTADEVFTTGTMGEITPVVKIDGRVIGSGMPGPMTQHIQTEYTKRTQQVEVILPDFLRPSDDDC